MKMTGNKTTKNIISFVLITILIVALSATSYAATLSPGGITGAGEGSDGNDAKVSVTKQVNVGEGVDLSKLKFDYVASLTDVFDHDISSAVYDSVRTINKPIAFSGLSSSSGMGHVIGSTGSFLPAGTAFPHAGVYEYKIKEKDLILEDLTTTPKSYSMKVYIKNGADELYVWGVTVEDEDEQAKIDPTYNPKGNGFLFVSSYAASAAPPKTSPTTPPPITPPPPVTSPALYTSLIIQNKIKNNTSGDEHSFKFVIKMVIPKINEKTSKKVSSDDQVHTKTVSPKTTALSKYKPGKTYIVNFELKDGQKKEFTWLPVGTIYTITEKAEPKYKATSMVTEDGGEPVNGIDGDFNTDYTVTVPDSPNRIKLVAGQGENKVVVINEFFDFVKTNFFIDNLPFILLLIYTVLFLFMYIKSRMQNGYAVKR